MQPSPLTGHHCSAPLTSLALTCVYLSLLKKGQLYKQDSLLGSKWCPYCTGFTVQDSLLGSQWCPYCTGFTVQDSLLGSKWCPYCTGFTVQDSLLGSQWCPYCTGFTVQDSLLGSQWCPYCKGFTEIENKNTRMSWCPTKGGHSTENLCTKDTA